MNTFDFINKYFWIIWLALAIIGVIFVGALIFILGKFLNAW